jgi:hypothetical protein
MASAVPDGGKRIYGRSGRESPPATSPGAVAKNLLATFLPRR